VPEATRLFDKLDLYESQITVLEASIAYCETLRVVTQEASEDAAQKSSRFWVGMVVGALAAAGLIWFGSSLD
jgi:hypothetical protein